MTMDSGLTAEDVRTIIRAEVGSASKCSASLPHGTLNYIRGPNLYRCSCGNVYRKNGHGGLEEVTS